MTDLTPNDLSHLSDEEFNALCPLGEHAPGPALLSPAAQAIMRAAGDSEPGIYATVAAALRAAAIYCTRERRILMTIANELDGQ